MSTAENLRTDIPHAARIYDYVLGGKDNFEVDRAAAESMMAASPLLAVSMRANRRFMTRVVARFAEQGFRQFLDIGTGLPTSPNLHEVVQSAAPDAAIVYVDNDPLVLVHARALLTPAPGSTGPLAYLDADLRDPAAIFATPEVRAFDLSRPVAVTMIAVLQLFNDDDQVRAIVADVMGRLAPGSALAISSAAVESDPEGVVAVERAANTRGVPVHARTKAQIEGLFGDLALQEPGVVPVNEWHPDEREAGVDTRQIGMYGGVALRL
jgi:O-methyltransferase involved in polyketide biosynthesis